MNFARDVVEAAEPQRLALVERARDGARREWSFGEVAEGGAQLAARLQALGVERGDVVLTLVGPPPPDPEGPATGPFIPTGAPTGSPPSPM